MSWKAWYSLLAISTLFLVFAFSVFQYEPPVSLGIIPHGVGFFDLVPIRYMVRVMVEYSIGYLEGNPFRPASGVAVTLVASPFSRWSRLYTSSSGEAVFFVPPGFHLLSVKDPLGLMGTWSSVIPVQRNMTVTVRFDLEKVRFDRISVNADFIQDASTLELEFTVPNANVTYVGNPFIVCWSSKGKLQTVGEKLLGRWVEPGTEETPDIYVIKLSYPTAILYVFPESSYMSVELIFVTLEGG